MIQPATNRNLPLWSFEFKPGATLEIRSRLDLERQIIKKAGEEKAFREELLLHPRTCLEKQFNLRIPEPMLVEVIEEPEGDLCLVLPHNPYEGIPEAGLRQALGLDLEDVAGWILEQQKGLLPEDPFLNARLLAKAWRDPEFKASLLSDPAGTLHAGLGFECCDELCIRVLEETATRVYIVLSRLPDFAQTGTGADFSLVNLPLVVGSESVLPTDTFAPDCTMTFSCPIP